MRTWKADFDESARTSALGACMEEMCRARLHNLCWPKVPHDGWTSKAEVLGSKTCQRPVLSVRVSRERRNVLSALFHGRMKYRNMRRETREDTDDLSRLASGPQTHFVSAALAAQRGRRDRLLFVEIVVRHTKAQTREATWSI